MDVIWTWMGPLQRPGFRPQSSYVKSKTRPLPCARVTISPSNTRPSQKSDGPRKPRAAARGVSTVARRPVERYPRTQRCARGTRMAPVVGRQSGSPADAELFVSRTGQPPVGATEYSSNAFPSRWARSLANASLVPSGDQ
jgi:hypothetical protein